MAGVENAFAPGGVCDRAWERMTGACERLRARLGAEDEDADLDAVIDSLLIIQRDLCERMFRLGLER